MNAITQPETLAIHTASALEVADPAKNLILVPLSQLLPRQSKRNVRKALRMSIPELAASIARVGLLQNLVVILAADGEHYEVVVGGRRLAALKLLAKKKRIVKDWNVPCLLVADGSARTASLTENVQREAMHPADQFEAFAALVAEGRPIEGIAADFSVTPLVVQHRLKLANVSPRLMTDYHAGTVTLEQLMALAITDDHATQEAAFYGAPQWQRSPSALREHLTEREIDAQHPLAHFVGLDAYTAAGGSTRRDLFAEDDSGIYLNDAALLERLVRDKLDAQAGDVRAEGWAWVEAVPHLSHADRQAFQNAPRQRREPNAREAKRIASLQARIDKADAALEDAYEAEDEDKTEALHEQRERLADELDTMQAGLLRYAPDVLAVAGAIVTIDRDGEAVIHRGLLREAEAKALRTLEKLRQGFTGAEGAQRGRRAAPSRQPVRPAGAASERAPHRRAANRSRPVSAGGTGRAGAWHGAERLAGQPLRPRPAAGREPESAKPAGRHGPRLAGVVRRRRPARTATGMVRTAAAGQRRTVRRASGDGARRAGAAAGRVRGRQRGRGNAPRHAAPARRGTGAGGRAGHGRMVAAECRRLLQPHPQGRDSGCRAAVRAVPCHPAGEAQEGRHCQQG